MKRLLLVTTVGKIVNGKIIGRKKGVVGGWNMAILQTPPHGKRDAQIVCRGYLARPEEKRKLKETKKRARDGRVEWAAHPSGRILALQHRSRECNISSPINRREM